MSSPVSVRPEPVEGLSLLFATVAREREGFDKLSPNGVGATLD
jgi:hypothetical protein